MLRQNDLNLMINKVTVNVTLFPRLKQKASLCMDL